MGAYGPTTIDIDKFSLEQVRINNLISSEPWYVVEASKNELSYIETSALDSSNVDQAFNIIVNCKWFHLILIFI